MHVISFALIAGSIRLLLHFRVYTAKHHSNVYRKMINRIKPFDTSATCWFGLHFTMYIFVSFPTSSSLFRLHSRVPGSLCLASVVPFLTLFFCSFSPVCCLHCNSKWKHAAFRRCFVVKIKFNTRAYQLIATSPSIELNWQQIASTYTTIKRATVLLLLVAARDNVFNRISIVAWSSLIFSAQHFASNFGFNSVHFSSVWS